MKQQYCHVGNGLFILCYPVCNVLEVAYQQGVLALDLC